MLARIVLTIVAVLMLSTKGSTRATAQKIIKVETNLYNNGASVLAEESASQTAKRIAMSKR